MSRCFEHNAEGPQDVHRHLSISQLWPTMRLALLLVLLSLPPTAVAAQGGYGPSGGGRRSPGGHPPGDGGSGRPMVAIDPAPPRVDVIASVATLDSSQQSRYAAAWDSLDHATEPLRDSIAVQDSVVRFAMGQGYQDAAKSHIELLNRLARTLHQRNDLFTHGLRNYLTRDQMKVYEKYLHDHREGPPLRELPSGRRTRR